MISSRIILCMNSKGVENYDGGNLDNQEIMLQKELMTANRQLDFIQSQQSLPQLQRDLNANILKDMKNVIAKYDLQLDSPLGENSDSPFAIRNVDDNGGSPYIIRGTPDGVPNSVIHNGGIMADRIEGPNEGDRQVEEAAAVEEYNV